MDNGYQSKNKSKPEYPDNTEQIIIVTTKKIKSNEGILYGIEYINRKWTVTFDTIKCTIGKRGFAELNRKKEGDLKTPSGYFKIGSAFGYKKDLNCTMDFIELNESHYWVDDANSEFYNKLIDFLPPKTSAEKMKREDHLYQYGIIIEYNTKDIIPGKGSAIFIHIERHEGDPTLGCVAISEQKMKELILWINPGKNPMIKMGANL